MGLFDRFKRRPHPLLEWLGAQGGSVHGRKLGFSDTRYEDGSRGLFVSLEGRPGPRDRLQFQRPQAYLTAEQAKALPSVHDPEWRGQVEQAQGLRLGGGWVLDPDFDPDSPLVARHGTALGGYLERFSRGVDTIVYEPPLLRILVAREGATPEQLRRDLECAHALLSLLEPP